MFIDMLVPGETARMKIGDPGSLEMRTTTVDHQILDQTTLKVAFGWTKDCRVVLVDTPGFNSARKSDSTVIRDIASCTEVGTTRQMQWRGCPPTRYQFPPKRTPQ